MANDTSSSLFQYTALPRSGQQHIRLLLLTNHDQPEQNSPDCRLRGELEPVCLPASNEEGSVTEYFAISYCWGDPSIVDQIWLNDNETLPLTASAAYALRCVPTGRKYWIDSICINQADNLEKAQQVALMWNIYHQARQVIASVGDSLNDYLPAIQLIDLWGLAGNHSWCANQIYLNVSTREVHETLHKYQLSWHALANLLSHPWFRRVWVIQEIVAARDVVLSCGSASTQWIYLTDLIRRLRDKRRLESLLHDSSNPGANHQAIALGVARVDLIHAFKNLRYMSPLLLQQCLVMSLGAEVSDPRDKIYAMLSLAPSNIPPKLMPSYDQSANTVFINTTRFLMEEQKSLFLLHFAGIGWSPSSKELPSWVPDFGAPSSGRINLVEYSRALQYGTFGFFPPEWCAAEVQSSPNSHHIVVQSRGIDRVKLLKEAWTFGRSIRHCIMYGKYADRLTVLKWFNRIKKGICESRTISSRTVGGRSFWARPGAEACFLEPGKCPCRESTVRKRPLLLGQENVWIYTLAGRGLSSATLDTDPHTNLIKAAHAFEDLLLRVVASIEDVIDHGIFETTHAEKGLNFADSMDRFSNWMFFETEKGYIGRGPPGIRKDDHVQVFRGFDHLVITRRSSASLFGRDPKDQYIGTAFIANYGRDDIRDAYHEITHPLVLI